METSCIPGILTHDEWSFRLFPLRLNYTRCQWSRISAFRFPHFSFSDFPLTLARLSQTIDSGEITVMALAKEINATAVLDDKAARREANHFGLKIAGTLGLLQRAAERKWMTQAQLIAVGLR
jgi:hypothetical protein